MIQGLLLRWGLGAVAGWILPGLLLGVGGLSAWWFEWTDWKTVILLIIAIGLIGQLAITQSPWARFAIALVVAGTCYVKGRIDEGLEMDKQLAIQKQAHKLEVEQIHLTYKQATDAEVRRQAEALQRSREEAERAQGTWETERQQLFDRMERLRKEAADDKSANRPALSADAVNRLNRLRHERRPRAGRGVPADRGKAKARPGALLDATPVPAAATTPLEGALPKGN